MEGTKMTKQERESMLYDEFDKFIYEPGESIHSYYMRYAKLINDMKMIPMSMTPMLINTKFVNHLQPEWSRFVTAAKQLRDLHNVTFDELYTFLKHNGRDAKEHYQSSTPITQQLIQSPLLQSYAPLAVQQPPTFQPDIRLAIPTFLPTDDPIFSLNKAMKFLTKLQFRMFKVDSLKVMRAMLEIIKLQEHGLTMQLEIHGQPRVITCYNCNGKGHMAKQCTGRKRVKDSEWFKDKMILAQAQEAGVVLDKEQRDFLAASLEEIDAMRTSSYKL
nr:integrase, catalytic region, zinc finger, CCHC-type, peptidase aspartic, catalytic [Tanacetum cinerariifolium]